MIILPKQITEALELLENAGFEAYVVGTCVRELVLGNSPLDYDIATSASINDIMFTFRDYRISDEGIGRGEIMVTILGMVVQVSPFRREVVGNRVMYADDLQTDLARRGFTMNAMAFSRKDGLIDPYDGKSALSGEVKQVVAIGENVTITTAAPKGKGEPVTEVIYDMTKSFTTKPSRLLKAIRFCAEDEYEIEARTRDCMRANLACFDYADTADIREELTRIVMGKFAARALEQNADILAAVLPEIEKCVGFMQLTSHHDYDVWTHISKSVGYAVPVAEIRFAMLFHDLGKPDCMSIDRHRRGHFKGHGERSRLIAESVMRRLEFPKEMADEISWLVFHHDVPIPVLPEGRKELKTLIRELGADDLRNLLQCEIADCRARKIESENQDTLNLRAALSALNEIMETGECYKIEQLAVTSRELLDRRIVSNETEAAELLNALFEIVLDKPSFNNRLMLIEFAEKSKERLEQMKIDAAKAAKDRQQRKKAQKSVQSASIPLDLPKKSEFTDRRNEPVYSINKNKK